MKKLGYIFVLAGLQACGGSAERDPGPSGGSGGSGGVGASGGSGIDGSVSGGSGGRTPDAGVTGGRGSDASTRVDAGPGPDATTPGAPQPGPSPRSIAIYDESRVIDLYLTFPAGQWEKLVNQGPLEGDERYVPCSLTFEGEMYPEAHCRRKGEPMHWEDEPKPQLIVRFNLVNKNGRFRGLRRLNLEYFFATDAPIRDRLGMWVMREAGLDAPRVNHARVYLDGKVLGLYQNIESLDKEFLEDHFGAAASDGNLWESGFELKTNETTPNDTRLVNLKAWVDREPLQGDHTAFWNAFDLMTDVDQIILELAAETAALTDDNFSNGAANYYYYEHPTRGFLVLPWDLDTIYAAEVAADLFSFWDGAPPNKMRQLINQHPAWRARFGDKLVDIRDRVLTRLPAQAEKVCAQIRNYYFEDPNKSSSLEAFDEECDWFKGKIPERIAEIRRVLGR